ncbi:MAG: DUF2244 domain-containing protein [Rhodobacteraceae bacterium]|nr:DUF2244 domain-containing protein [Paracoccaceae bacterium]
MPVIWNEIERAPAQSGAFSDSTPVLRLVLTPHRSLPRRGFAWFLLILWGLLTVPLLPLLGTVVVWVMLPFALAALALIWAFVERNYRDGNLSEELLLWADRIEVTRTNPRRASQHWQANPYWTSLHLRATGGPVEDYLTLKGNGREIELGAFLSPDERRDLHDRLQRALARANAPGLGDLSD